MENIKIYSGAYGGVLIDLTSYTNVIVKCKL